MPLQPAGVGDAALAPASGHNLQHLHGHSPASRSLPPATLALRLALTPGQAAGRAQGHGESLKWSPGLPRPASLPLKVLAQGLLLHSWQVTGGPGHATLGSRLPHLPTVGREACPSLQLLNGPRSLGPALHSRLSVWSPRSRMVHGVAGLRGPTSLVDPAGHSPATFSLSLAVHFSPSSGPAVQEDRPSHLLVEFSVPVLEIQVAGRGPPCARETAGASVCFKHSSHHMRTRNGRH